MRKKHFTKQELKIIKYKLMKNGYNEEKASKEIGNMIECAEKNHEKAIIEEKRKKQHEHRYKKGRFQYPK